jgi:hypothetical protein
MLSLTQAQAVGKVLHQQLEKNAVTKKPITLSAVMQNLYDCSNPTHAVHLCKTLRLTELLDLN